MIKTLISVLLIIFSICRSTFAADQGPPDILKSALQKEAQPGAISTTYLTVSRSDPGGTIAEITVLTRQDGSELLREEEKNTDGTVDVDLKNDLGQWILTKDKAILLKYQSKMKSIGKAFLETGSGNMTSYSWSESDKTWDDKPCIQVEQKFSQAEVDQMAEAMKVIYEKTNNATANMKKIHVRIAVEKRYIIEKSTGALLGQEAVNADGDIITGIYRKSDKKRVDIDEAFFQVPKNLKIVEASSPKELLQLLNP